MTTEVIERNDGITVIEIGIPGPQGPPGTLIEVEEDGVVKTTPLRNLDFRTGFDVSEPTSRTAQIDLDLSEVAAGGELSGTLDAPTVDATHSGSTHQSIADDLNAHEIDAVGAHNASAVAFTPTGTISAADTQSAVVEALTDAKTYTDDGHVILSSQRGAVDGVAGLDSGGTIPDAQIPVAVARDTEVSSADAAHVAAADPHTGYQKESEKGATSGYASLDSAGKVPTAQIPAVAFGSVFVVASQAEMLALAANPGDIAVRSDVSQTFILTALPASTLGNWVELLSGAGGVTSVNGATGAVTGVELTANKGAASGYAALDGSGFVPDAQIASTIARDTEYTAADAAHVAAGDPHAGYQKESEKGALSGYAALDGSGYVPDAQINPAIARDTEVSDAVTAHTGDATAAHAASALSIADVANQYAATDVEAALAEVLDTEQAHEADVAGAHAASAVGFTPAGSVAATDVQAAITEVASEYASADSTHAAAVDPHAGYLLESLLDAKGDLVVASAADTPARLAAGTDYQQLVADSAATSGLRWKKQSWFDIEDYGADPTGVADSTTAINTANTAAGTTGTLFARADAVFKITAGLNAWKCHVQMAGATINFTPADNTTGTAVTIGDGTSTYVDNKVIWLPDIVKTSRYWSSTLTGTDTGLKMWAVIHTAIHIGRIFNFSLGAYAVGGTSLTPSSGFVWNEIHIRKLDNNKVNLRIGDGGSYNNENNWYGGRYNHQSGTANQTGARHIYIEYAGGLNPPNNHRFYGASLEGDVAQYTVECQGADNLFFACRWESSPKVFYNGAAATDNQVMYGYAAKDIAYTESGGATRNHAFTRNDWSLRGSGGTDGVLRLVNTSSSSHPALIVATAGTSPLTANLATDWQAVVAANWVAMKAVADTDFAIRMHAGGRIEFGDKAGTVTTVIRSGTGSPEGVVTANVGAVYLRSDGGAATSLYVKESGAGNTGWVAASTGAGVSSFAKSGATALTGAVTISGGANVTLTQTGQDVSIAASDGIATSFLSTIKWGAD